MYIIFWIAGTIVMCKENRHEQNVSLYCLKMLNILIFNYNYKMKSIILFSKNTYKKRCKNYRQKLNHRMLFAHILWYALSGFTYKKLYIISAYNKVCPGCSAVWSVLLDQQRAVNSIYKYLLNQIFNIYQR